MNVSRLLIFVVVAYAVAAFDVFRLVEPCHGLEIHGMTYAWFSESFNNSYFAQDVPAMLTETSSDWVAVYIQWAQHSLQSSNIMRTEETLTDDGIRALVKQIRTGLPSAKVMLKVIITLPGNASMFINPSDPPGWFQSYRGLILPLAGLAAETGAEALCIGVELPRLTIRPEYHTYWSGIISDIRAVYSGSLTYASLCWVEYERVTFWGELDWIGLDAYWNLTALISPSAPLVQAWETQLHMLAKWRASRPDLAKQKLVFTEIGYPAASLCTSEPSAPRPDACTGVWTPDPMCPYRAYNALFKSLETVLDVLDGIFVFYWATPTQRDGPGGAIEPCFYSVRHPPVLDVIQEFYESDKNHN